MAKTESTAVNDLIKIATTQTPLAQGSFRRPDVHDPAEEGAIAARRWSRGACPPLRVRATGTQEHAIAMPA